MAVFSSQRGQRAFPRQRTERKPDNQCAVWISVCQLFNLLAWNGSPDDRRKLSRRGKVNEFGNELPLAQENEELPKGTKLFFLCPCCAIQARSPCVQFHCRSQTNINKRFPAQAFTNAQKPVFTGGFFSSSFLGSAAGVELGNQINKVSIQNRIVFF